MPLCFIAKSLHCFAVTINISANVKITTSLGLTVLTNLSALISIFIHQGGSAKQQLKYLKDFIRTVNSNSNLSLKDSQHNILNKHLSLREKITLTSYLNNNQYIPQSVFDQK